MLDGAPAAPAVLRQAQNDRVQAPAAEVRKHEISFRAAEVTIRPAVISATGHAARSSVAVMLETAHPERASTSAPAASQQGAYAQHERTESRGDSALSLLSELRGALRGRTEPELVEVLGQSPAKVAALTERLSTAGAIVRRGSRWFPA